MSVFENKIYQTCHKKKVLKKNDTKSVTKLFLKLKLTHNLCEKKF